MLFLTITQTNRKRRSTSLYVVFFEMQAERINLRPSNHIGLDCTLQWSKSDSCTV